MKSELDTFTNLSPTKYLIIFICTFFVGYIFSALSLEVVQMFPLDPGQWVLAGSTIQNILAFIFPSFLVAYMAGSKRAPQLLGIKKAPRWNSLLGVILLYLLCLPLLNQLIEWNQSVSFPDSLWAIENKLRTWEDNAAKFTELIFAETSLSGLIIQILIVGILTGFAEEAFFRGGLQRIFISMNINPHVAIWCAAIIFSAMHFQFFGFLPRMLLGALFGYLYWWTGSLWVAAFAHALNNSITVIFQWLTTNYIISFDIDKFGVVDGSFPVASLLSLAATLIMIHFRKYFFNRYGAA